ncbi:hypothetical protein ACFOWX_03635 [Sphingorhabdus arenilitoris]|uniref:TldD/PmbA family protein n=1 Tax=Sphingorhabdus arenilitoris TaxID=1490041 RepID=A0ABV8RDT4_9SPHN
MSLDQLEKQAIASAEAAAHRVAIRIAADADLPPDVRAETRGGEIILSARNLRQRMIRDSRIRNFARKGTSL